MFLDYVKNQKIDIKSFSRLVEYFEENESIWEIEKLLSTLAPTSVLAERSCLNLKFLKNKRRTSLTQKYLNTLSITYFYKQWKVDLNNTIEVFILRNKQRRDTFARK